jgi:uncharacterized protein (DUF2461 family)
VWFSRPIHDLKRIRKDIELILQRVRKILNSKSILDNFVELTGNVVPTSPRGFSKDHEAIDLIRHKQFILRHNFTDKVIDPSLFTR